MADENNTEPKDVVTQVEIQQGPGVRVLAQYIRDLSFENPRAPESLRGETPPQIDLDVELKLITSAKREGETVFFVELVYGGLFQVEGAEGQNLEPVLLIECPRYLFPFARRVIADLTAEGGFPPFRVDPIDFAAIYMARQAQVAASQNGAGQA